MFFRGSNTRAKQIEGLKSEMQGIGAKLIVLQEGAEYAIDLHLTGPTQLRFRLMIFLPPDFPRLAPAIRVLADLSHPILNERGEVIFGLVRDWNERSSLGDVVRGVLVEFRQSKPIIKGSQVGMQAHQPHPPSTPPPSMYPGAPSEQPVEGGYTRPKEFDELANKSEEELLVLLNNAEDFEQWFGQLAEVRERTERLRSQMQNNAEIAVTTLSRKQEYEELNQEVEQLRAQFQDKKTSFDQQFGLQEAHVKEARDEDAILRRLQDAINQADAESESIAQGFCDGDIPVADFVKQYKQHRKVYHMRNAKKEMVEVQGV